MIRAEKVAAMTDAQVVAVVRLCSRYGVVFDPEAWAVGPFDLPAGYIAGWVGREIYVGISPEGEVSS